jgi:lipoprotein NlpI
MPPLFLLAAWVAAADPVADARAALRRDDPAAARDLLAPVVKAHPDRADAQELFGAACLRLRDNAAAAAAFEALVKLDPKSVAGHDRLGDAYLKLGRFADAVAEFDKVLELRPEFAPEHWRRGIALYYAGRYADGVKQFETHKTANPEDVENAAWHYLCNAKVVGREKARAGLIAVTRDGRVPMAEIQKLFAGKLTPADVLAAADAVPAGTDRGTEARFYGNLYVALWHEAEGDATAAKKHLSAAVETYKISHYMWDVAAAHVGALKK